MSGVSLAVAPRSEADQSKVSGMTSQQKSSHRPQQDQTGGVMGSLRVIELQLVAFIMVFSASGLVPLLDLVFPAFATAYLFALSRLAFPAHGKTNAPPEVFHNSKLFRFYVILGTTIGLFFPLAYVLGGFARGDDHAVRSATPHLFLLSFQILTENLISGFALFSPPVRALVPLLYTIRRLFVILDWLQDDVSWYWFGRGLAAANLVYFSINLLVFLIPRFLPRAFERYFSERDEMHSKAAEDNYAKAAAKQSKSADEKKSD
ncbi:hypothetical protein ACET3Z_004497 [Daucus carota]